MIIAGLQKLTLLDYPQHLAATVFTRGCNMRCPYCYNVDLVLPTDDADENIDALGFLQSRKGLLDGVCITGGEPTLQPDLPAFCTAVHELGLNVKLDTNGTRPRVVAHLIENHLVDYVAMDIKNTFDAYPETTGLVEPYADEQQTQEVVSSVRESMRIIAAGNVDFEFRTTVATETHPLENLMEIAQVIAQTIAECAPTADQFKGWFLQRFDEHAPATVGDFALHAWTKEQLEEALPELRRVLPQTYLRGVD